MSYAWATSSKKNRVDEAARNNITEMDLNDLRGLIADILLPKESVAKALKRLGDEARRIKANDAI